MCGKNSGISTVVSHRSGFIGTLDEHRNICGPINVLTAQVFREKLFTLLGTAAVSAGPRVGRVLGVAGGGAVPRPIEIIVLVLGEHADGLLLEAAVELSWRATEQSHTLTIT